MLSRMIIFIPANLPLAESAWLNDLNIDLALDSLQHQFPNLQF